MSEIQLHHGDCTAVLPTMPAASVDAVITDPPYPCIDREYGRWTEEEWFALMRVVVPECMRVLKPSGSAVFILQPNSERVGRMRTWLWEFMLWVGKEWGIVQDAWWWNHAALPVGGAITKGLLRASLKACVWVGAELATATKTRPWLSSPSATGKPARKGGVARRGIRAGELFATKRCTRRRRGVAE
jgi:hypothetical protein